MTDKNEQPDTNKSPRPRQDKILRAKDIIPGAGGTAGPDEESEAAGFDIPRFNLAKDIMAAQRRQSTVRRKGPGEAEDPSTLRYAGQAEGRREKTEHPASRPQGGASLKSYAEASRIETLRDSVIAEIVARDIERLCAGH